MLLKDFTPSPDLHFWVRCFRICHFTFDPTAIIPTKLYPPKPETILHFFLRDAWAIDLPNGQKEYQSPITLTGQRTHAVKQYNGGNFLDFQIVFHPTGLFNITGISAQELTDQALDAENVFAIPVRFTLEQLQEAGSYQEILWIGENFVKSLLPSTNKQIKRLDLVTHQMWQLEGKGSLEGLAREACLSPKQFNRKFLERTGVNPKLYLRIIRFNKAFNLRNRYPECDWLSIALKCGYYDYQHLTKEYIEFTGFTPIAFHQLEKSSPEYVLGLTPSLYQSRVEW
ncbi:MAG: AraC family transcriptional regulator [Verrucomicrobia bacterium]|nr:AraC family transcriptional regulator [Cytophagales bacterium]